ncbi:MAG: FAD/NAD(P)-binding protein [Candidatus Omnitrophica bacterium]|nr:FAD/NAD(P)-binding protein [Candidatus Omnitrophota bacterium]
MNMINPYSYIESEIIEIRDETPNIKTFTLRPKQEIPFMAGQFMDVSIPGAGEAPFTPSSNHNISKELDFTIMSAGSVTKMLHNMEKGRIVGVRGPYGTAYPINNWKSKEVFIVGGGVGLAPLRALLYALFNNVNDYKKITLKYGAKTSKDIAYVNEIDSWKRKADNIDVELTVDVGDETWKGKVGIVTTIVNAPGLDLNNAVGVVCGPPIMMKFVTFKLLDLGFRENNIYLSMEKNMSCGIGKCGHCRIGPYYACKDGPVFTYDKLKKLPNIWD